MSLAPHPESGGSRPEDRGVSGPIADRAATSSGPTSWNGSLVPGDGRPASFAPLVAPPFTEVGRASAGQSTPAAVSAASPSPEPGDPSRSGGAPDPRWDEEVARLLRRPETLRCVYQPVVDLRTGDCTGYEALTRVANWPARSPQPWFDAAARTGLAGQLEAATLTNALHGRRALVGEQFLAVNLAAALLPDPAVLGVLAEQPTLDGLVLELGWDEPGPDGPVPVDAIEHVRGRGALIACDVVDAGRPDLERLRRTAPDLVKLDGGLVKGVHADPVRDRVLRLVVAMADELGAVVLAEGLESLDDARHLQALGVRMAQGWLFGRARPSFIPPAAEVSTWLRTTWEETVTRSRVGRLARHVGAADPGQTLETDWTANLDDEGRLVALVAPDGVEHAASRLLRLRSSQDLRSAALRVLASGGDRRLLGVIVIVDDDGRFVGITDSDSVLRQMLAASEGRSPLPLRS